MMTMMMSEHDQITNVQLSDLFALTAPMIVHQMNPVPQDAEELATDGRRPVPGRRGHQRPGGGRPVGSGARRNERERNRVRQVNAGFDRLRDHVPQGRRNRKLSKVDTLRAAVEYIGHLQTILRHEDLDLQLSGDENYAAGSTDDVIDSWYLNSRLCGGDTENEASMMQLLVSPEDITRALQSYGSGSTSSGTTDQRLAVDLGSFASPNSDGLSLTGSVGCGACQTPESVDQEVTSSSLDDQLDDDAEQLLSFGSWLS